MKKFKVGDKVRVKEMVSGETFVHGYNYKIHISSYDVATVKEIIEADSDQSVDSAIVEFLFALKDTKEQIVVKLDNLVKVLDPDKATEKEQEKAFYAFRKKMQQAISSWDRLHRIQREFDIALEDAKRLPGWENWCKENDLNTEIDFGDLSA